MDIGSQINLVIDNICNQLGTTVENLIPELSKYKATSALAACVVGGILFIGFIITGIIIYRYGKGCSNYDDQSCFTGLGIFIVVVGIVIAIIIWSVNIYKYIIWSQSPTGATVEWIVDQLRRN